MEVPFNLLKSCLVHILTNRVGKIQSIMPSAVLLNAGELYTPMYNTIPNQTPSSDAETSFHCLPLSSCHSLASVAAYALVLATISSNSDCVKNRHKISKGSAVC